MNDPIIPQSKLMDIRFLSPTLVLFLSVVTFLSALPILPVTVEIPLAENAVFFWLICFVSFLVGTMVGGGKRTKIRILRRYQSNPKSIKKFVTLVVIIGCIGTVLLLVDRYLVRGISLTANVLENRETMSSTGASAISIISAITSSLGLLSYIPIWVAQLHQVSLSLWIKIASAVNLMIALFVSAGQMGSRSLLLVVLMVHLVAWYFIIRARGGKVNFKYIFSGVLVLLCCVLVSAQIMYTRLDLMGSSVFYSISNSAYSYTIKPSQSMLNAIHYHEGLAVAFGALFSLVQYVFHGFYEFSVLFTNFQGENELGNRTLWLPIKFVSILTAGWLSPGSFDNMGVRNGVFATYVGPFFIDFGLFSPIVLFFFGAFLGFPFRLLRMRRFEWLPTVSLSVTGAVLWPVVNIFESASGGYLIAVSILIGLFGRCLHGK